jgi:hypothetical protein
MTTTTPALLTVREALILLGWLGPDDKVTWPLTRRLLDLCAAKGIAVEQFRRGGAYWVGGPGLAHYIASLQPTAVPS